MATKTKLVYNETCLCNDVELEVSRGKSSRKFPEAADTMDIASTSNLSER